MTRRPGKIPSKVKKANSAFKARGTIKAVRAGKRGVKQNRAAVAKGRQRFTR